MILVALIAELVLAVAFLLTGIRLWHGPTMANRVVALDLLSVLAVGFMAAEAVRSGQPSLVDAAVVVAIVGFIATAAFALLIDREQES